MSGTSHSADDGYIVECVKEMEQMALDDYGFNVMRTYYADESLWASFKSGFDSEIEKGIAAAPPACADAMKSMEEKVLTRFSDDTDLDGQGPEGISAAFQIFCLDENDEDDGEDEEEEEDEEDEDEDKPWSHDMGPGIIRSMCLMVDEASMKSLGGPTPYVVAVDALLHTGVDLGYSGHFKVAIDSLMPNFYAAIGHFGLDEVAAAVDQDGIWRGMRKRA